MVENREKMKRLRLIACRRTRLCYGLSLPTKTPKSNAEDVNSVANVATHKLQTTIAVVPPPHWNLSNTVTSLSCQVQNLDVVHIAVNSLPRKKINCHMPLKELESTLG